MLVCVFFCARLHTRPRVQRAPGIPCALLFSGRKIQAQLGRIAPRDREGASEIGFGCLKMELGYLRRPGQAKRDPGPITTNVNVARSWGRNRTHNKLQ
jgi:hypothetical protein